MLTTTLNAIRAHHPCREGWTKLLAHLDKTRADDEPLPFATIAQSNGFSDALWCLRVLPDSYRPAIVSLACDFAERALRFVPEGEERPKIAIDTARKCARGEATLGDVRKAAAAAYAYAYAAYAAADAADAAAYAAYAAYAAAAAAAAAYDDDDDERKWQLSHFNEWSNSLN